MDTLTKEQILDLLLNHHDSLDDLQMLDYIQFLYSRNAKNVVDDNLLKIAKNATKPFGTTLKLPLSSLTAWSMLNVQHYVNEFIEQLKEIDEFITTWRERSDEFLILQHPEMDLIEYFFEQLHPRHHGLLIAKIMDYKVLSIRRLGLLRRLAYRTIKRLNENKNDAAIQYAKDNLALLDHIARPGSFELIRDEAQLTAEKIVKVMQPMLQPPPQQLQIEEIKPPSEIEVLQKQVEELKEIIAPKKSRKKQVEYIDIKDLFDF